MIKPRKIEAETVANEFAGAQLGDARLSVRLGAIVHRLAAAPDVAFPRALATGADLEGFYRFIRNEAVTPGALLRPHVDATVSRLSDHREVLAVHDTTEFRFGGAREDLGRLTKSGHGFLGHFALAVTVDERRDPLGTLALETWTRSAATATAQRKAGKISVSEAMQLPNEQDRWWRGIEVAEAAAGGTTSLVHVMDSEADDYDLMSKLVAARRRWVIRLCYDRVLATSPRRKTKEFVSQREVLCTRHVQLSRRHRQPGGTQRKRAAPREQRSATLSISASPVEFRRSTYYGDDYPKTLTVNIVSVREIDAPPDAEPIDWLLITTEPIDTEDEVLKVVDCYRGRWRIEELFKALKTGCAFEKRQLESRQTLLNALALFVPVAWGLLRLRTCARATEDVSAAIVLDPEQIVVLRKASETPLPSLLSARAAMLAIARIGGHLRSNGDPGWLVLGRGYQDLLMMVAGYRLATVKCDPS